jgi:biofilm PGA synthesis N-glycosyltransferase PgaC
MPAKISAGIPAYNEEKTIGQLLKTLLNQPMGDVVLEEVIVETGGSTDSTDTKAREMIQSDSRIKVMSKGGRRGKSAALDTILRHAKEEVVVFIDGDVFLGDNCVSALIRPLLNDVKVGVASGTVISKMEENHFFGFLSHFIREQHRELCTHLTRRNMAPKVDGTFYAVRKSVVESFPTYAVSDDEYASWRAQSKGYKVIYVPDAVVYTEDPASFKGFIEWQKRIIAGQMYMKKHFNYVVPTTKASVLLPIFLKLTRKHWRRFHHVLTLLLLEFISFILSFRMFFQHKVPYIYG